MRIFDIFEQIEATPGKIAKANLLKNLTDLQQEMFMWALDPGRVYFVRIKPHSLEPAVKADSDATIIAHARSVLRELSTRAITGEAARIRVQAMLACCDALQQKWLSRIINKDLQIGVDTQFRDIYPDAYKVFEPQLCKTWDGEDVDGWYYEDKWNGLRALGVPSPWGVHGWFSRNGKPIPGMEAVSEELATARMPHDYLYVFDGEGFGGDWDDQVGQTVSKIRGNKGYEDITFNVFDIIELSQWQRIPERGFKTSPLAVRREILVNFFGLNPQLKKIRLVNQGRIDMAAGITPVTARDEAISRRLEGIILKNPDAHYRPGKHTNGWYKFKKREPIDVEIVGAVEGIKKCAGMLGAIVVRHEGVDSEIGTGFSDLQRHEFWEMHQRGELAGHTAEVEYGEITKDGKLFHTAFKRLRFDK